jgi:hypothetical protein
MGAAKIKAQESSGGRSLEFNSIQGRRRQRLRSRGRRKQARRVDSGLDRTSRRQAQKRHKAKSPAQKTQCTEPKNCWCRRRDSFGRKREISDPAVGRTRPRAQGSSPEKENPRAYCWEATSNLGTNGQVDSLTLARLSGLEDWSRCMRYRRSPSLVIDFDARLSQR